MLLLILLFQIFCQRGGGGADSDKDFYLIKGKMITEADHHRPTGETPLKWRFAGGPMMAQQ